MLTSWAGVVLRDKSGHSQGKAPPNSLCLMMNEQNSDSPWNMRVTRKCHKLICLNCVQLPVISMGLRRNVCVHLCVCVPRIKCCNAITCLKWWPNYDSLLQHAALQNQPPWNWLPAHLDLIWDYFSLTPPSLLGPCSFPTTGEKRFFKDACIKKYLYINRPMQSHVEREKVQKGINFCWDVRKNPI